MGDRLFAGITAMDLEFIEPCFGFGGSKSLIQALPRLMAFYHSRKRLFNLLNMPRGRRDPLNLASFPHFIPWMSIFQEVVWNFNFLAVGFYLL